MIKKISFFFALLFSDLFNISCYGQYSFAMDLIPAYWQGNVLNPANYPKNQRINISLPHLQAGFQLTPFSLFKSYQKDSSRIQLHPENTLQSMDSLNRIDVVSQIQTISLGFKWHETNWIALGHSLKSRASIQFPALLAQLIYYGNKPFIGQNIDLDTRFEGIFYQEYYVQLGFQGKSIPTWNWGIKFKILDGITGLSTGQNEASLFTNPVNYSLSGRLNYRVNVSSITSRRPFSNIGAAIDIGIQYQNEKVSFAGAIADLGMIKWNESRQLSIDKNISFNGLALLNAGQSIDADFNIWIDTLKKEWEPEWKNRTFTGFLPLKLFLNSSYAIAKKSHFSAFIFFEHFSGIITAKAGFGFHQQIASFMDIGINVRFNALQQYQLGNQVGLKVGKLRIFASLDNWISLMHLSDTFRGIGGMMGLNYVMNANNYTKGNTRSRMNEKKFFRK